MKKRLLIIDSHAILHRAFHALPPLATKKGELVNAVYGFLLVFFKAIQELQPSHIVATFDLPGPTLRHKVFKGYKAKRPKTPEELCEQIPRLKEILAAFEVPVFEEQGYEADDLIGTISQKTERQQVLPKPEIIILTGDLDALQLIDESTKVYALRKGVKDTVLYDELLVKEKYEGLKPSQLLDFRALRGDPSDNIPGVTGIGEKTAIKLLKDFGTLENLYQELPTTNYQLPTTLKAKLLDQKDQAFLSKQLAEIRKDAPIEFHLENCRFGRYNREKVVKILEEFEFYSLIKRLPGFQKSKKHDKLKEAKVEGPKTIPSGIVRGQQKTLF